MLGFDRRAAKAAWTVSLVALALVTLYAVRSTVFVLVLALFFAYMVYPLVARVSKLAPKRVSHTLATGLVFALLLIALAIVISLIGPPIAEQASTLSQQIPTLSSGPHILDKVPLPDWLSGYRGRLAQFINDNLKSGTAYAMPIAKNVAAGALTVASNMIYVVLIPILAFLLIKDGSAMRDWFLGWTDRSDHARMWKRIVDDLDTLLGGYMRALLILSLTTVVVYGVVFSLAGVQFGLLLAVLAGILEFVPVLGPLAAAAIVAAVALLSGYDHLLAIIGFIALYRIFQDYVLNPYLMSEGVTVPPLMVLLGLVAGDEISGVVGVFLSVPVLAAAKIFVKRIAEEWQRKHPEMEHDPDDTAEPAAP